MNKTTIIMACDDNLVFAVANMIIGIKRYCYNDVLKIVIMYDNIQKEEIDKVRSIWLEKIEFKLYSKNDFFERCWLYWKNKAFRSFRISSCLC
ncbi:hypothetical protein [Campylobacter coli]|uniref:hypothetical protein n=1 Tax=Campylobacter coli TaxID=195 RepID=UPI00092E67AE|nr:hypothetical protein [Campylobacter coli]